MSDRELLEAAAKAAGYDHLLWTVGGFRVPGEKEWWNPLIDDGDALRLAVKLSITDLALVVGRYVMEETHREGDDIYAITRRAIVRAAASISGDGGRSV